jgi:hypothetical protein
MKDIVYEIRCFKDGKRLGTHKLSKTDAKYLRITARHLSAFLTKSYKLGR